LTDQSVIDNYKRLGVNLVPIPKGSGKRLTTKWGQYQREFYTGNIPTDQDFAVILGPVSGNLIVIDFDECPNIQEVLDVMDGCLDVTLVSRTGDGYHLYVRVTECPKLSNTYLTKGSYKMEVKSKGAYVIGISSDHYESVGTKQIKTGKKYQQVSHCNDIVSLNATGDELIKKLNELGWVSSTKISLDTKAVPTARLLEGGWSAGSRHNNGYKLALRRFTDEKWTYDEVLEEAMKINETNTPPSPIEEVERWVSDGYQQYKKNKADPESGYQSNIKKLIEGEKRKEKEDQLANIATKLIEKYHFKAYMDTEELLLWNGKSYEFENAEGVVKEECEESIDGCTQNNCNEVIAKIKRKCFFQRNQFNSYVCSNCNGVGCEGCLGTGKDNIVTVDNGILDVRRKVFKEHDNNNLNTFYFPVKWDAEYDDVDIKNIDYDKVDKVLDGTLFWKYLKECFTVDGKYTEDAKKDVYTVLESMAYVLLNNNNITKTVMFVGSGNNGKTVLLDYTTALFGRKNITRMPIQEIADGGFVIARLDGKIANICSDIDPYELRKSGQLKQIIGGEGVEVQKKYQEPYTMYPRAKFIFSANKFPKTYDQTNGFFRRFVIVQWNRHFTNEEVDTMLGSKLANNEKEKSLVFRVLVELANALEMRGNFRFTKDVDSVRNMWNELADPIFGWVKKRLIDDVGNLVTKREAYEDYVHFCTNNEVTPLKIGKFGQEFKQFYEETTVRNQDTKSVSKYWCDFKIKPRDQNGELDKYTSGVKD